MTWQTLSEATPRPGQAVTYRLRPNGAEATATYQPSPPTWIHEDGSAQTARGHHEWTPTGPAPRDSATHALLQGAVRLHPELGKALAGEDAKP